MAKKVADTDTKTLVIVESPTKAKTIGKFLGNNFLIEASIGHIRDLPGSTKEIPEQYKGEEWSRLGVNVNKDFEPIYIIPPEKKDQVKKLKGLLKQANRVFLATDEDREGEAISWHLFEILKPKVPVERLVFHEITQAAINKALQSPRQIDNDLVRAQEARRILDRLYGYEVSPLLWKKVKGGLSAGRVQSVATRLIVGRERERMEFVSASYWDLLGKFAKESGENFTAQLVSVDDRKIPSSKDFDEKTGKLKNAKLLQMTEQEANDLAARLQKADFEVTKVEDKPYTSKPYPPFTTSTLQQEANRKLNFTARKTMQVAQNLYENGRITYMRTDSTNLAEEAISKARSLITSAYGSDYLPAKARIYSTKVKNAQEAHEAIRPAGEMERPDDLRGELSGDAYRLYDLIWKRTVASQMENARGRRITVLLEGDKAVFRAAGKTIDFPGYFRAYVEGTDDPEAELADKESLLPSVVEQEKLACEEINPSGHNTQPPARFTEATLTRTLEQLGIGRPSTYANIIETIIRRQYVDKRGNALVPTWTAFAVIKLMESHLPELVDYQFTARMEDDLDAISRGEAEWIDYLSAFYFGTDHPGLKKQLENKVEEIDPRLINRINLGQGEDEEEVYVRVGKWGPYLEHGERKATVPESISPDELTLETALELLDRAALGDEPLGTCPDTNEPIYLKEGRYGSYIQRGDGDKPQRASLLKGMEPKEIDLQTALRLLKLPREVGLHPKSNEPIIASNGRFGPYIKCDGETRSLPADLSPLDISLQEAVDLLAQPKKGKGGFKKKKEPIKTFDESPVTGNPIELLEGRYGPYVSDGETNASIPKGTAIEEVTRDQALELLKERAAKAPAKKKKKKKTSKKKTSKKAATAKKKSTKKKTTKKKKATKKKKPEEE
ncbi:Type I DNA topoisomerase [Planctomycetales bacterium 10988]|nr:Type I DNA topoisomerase [Planctomycetales bacterium 10988]